MWKQSQEALHLLNEVSPVQEWKLVAGSSRDACDNCGSLAVQDDQQPALNTAGACECSESRQSMPRRMGSAERSSSSEKEIIIRLT